MKAISPIINYLAGAKDELSKVIWPSRKVLINDTLTVVAVVAVAMLIVGVLDYILTFILKWSVTRGI